MNIKLKYNLLLCIKLDQKVVEKLYLVLLIMANNKYKVVKK
jgi:hypothetical protein